MCASYDHVDSDFRIELDLLYKMCEVVDSPRSLYIAMLVNDRQWDTLANISISPLHYEILMDGARRFNGDNLVTGFLKKSPNLPLKVDREQEAINTFFEGEAQCARIARELFQISADEGDEVLISTIKAVRYQVFSIVRQLTKRDFQNIEDGCKFGPGTSTEVNGAGWKQSDKYSKNPHLTEGIIPFYKELLGERWHRIATNPKVVKGSIFKTVPKNAKTNRGICVEPSLNILMQKGIGTVLRQRLAYAGNSIQSQDNNRRLVRLAVDRRLATIDLKAASDTVSWALVGILFPTKWVELFGFARSRTTNIKGDTIFLRKVSSMGNGFTFELESIIFLAVVRSIVPVSDWNDCSVYGDDIICPQAYAASVIQTLVACGFVVNTEKTFLEGVFFESCGSDYFNSQNVRPFFAKGSKPPIDYRMQLANALRLYTSRSLGGVACDGRFRKVWQWLVNNTPSDVRRLRVPPHFGDVGIIDSPPRKTYSSHKTNEYQRPGFRVRHMSYRTRQCDSIDIQFLLYKLHSLGFNRSDTKWSDALFLRNAEDIHDGREDEAKLSTTWIPVTEWILEGLDWWEFWRLPGSL